MKSYAVLCKIGSFSATVVFESDKLSDVEDMCLLLARNEENEYKKYFIAQSILSDKDVACIRSGACACAPAPLAELG